MGYIARPDPIHDPIHRHRRPTCKGVRVITGYKIRIGVQRLAGVWEPTKVTEVLLYKVYERLKWHA